MINMRSFTVIIGIKLTTSQECFNNIHNKFMEVAEGIYSQLSFNVGLVYIGFFHMSHVCVFKTHGHFAN